MGKWMVSLVISHTNGQMDGFFSQFPYKCHLEEVASVGDLLKICPQLDSRVATCAPLPSSFSFFYASAVFDDYYEMVIVITMKWW